MSSTTPAQSTVQNVESIVVAILIVALGLAYALHRFKLRRPDLEVGTALFVGMGLRLIAAAGVSSTGLQSTLRGGDEQTYLFEARQVAELPFGLGYLPSEQFELHTVVFALQMRFADFGTGPMRVTQVAMAMLAVLLIVVAVHDFAGARAAKLAAWLLAFEPASIFFNSGLSKEPLMLLATAVVIYGGSRVWRHLDVLGIAVMGLGCLIAVETRQYAGWFLVSGSAVLILHAGLRRMDRPLQAMPLVYGVMIAAFLVAPTVIQATSADKLKELQASQDYSTRAEAKRNSTGPNADNLALERVDFSTREAVFSNLPRRMADVVTRPYPWQISNASQQLGAVGSIVALGALFLTIQLFWEWRGRSLSVVGPFLYPLVFLLMAYGLSAGNAGTGFRYRTHLVMIGLAMLVAHREHPERPSKLLRARRLAAIGAPHPQNPGPLPDSGLAATTLRG